MKSRFTKSIILLVVASLLLLSSCLTPQAFSAQDIKLNKSVQERYASGEREEQGFFEYGQGTSDALDIVVPIDPSGTREIAKAHNYYLSKGSQVEFNIETLIKFSTYEIDGDMEEHGELKIPSQWMSVCTFLDPTTGKKLKQVGGDDAKIVFSIEEASDVFTSYLRRCSGFQSNHPYLTEGGPLSSPCQRYELSSSTDPFRGQNLDNSKAYPLCLLGGRITLQESSSFSHIIDVSSYNDAIIDWEDLSFQSDIEPTFIVVDDTVTPYRVHMTPDTDNATVVNNANAQDHFVRYHFTMPLIDGLYAANFASDISIAYIRFYWTDTENNLIPILHEPQLDNPKHAVQVGQRNKCRRVDDNGYFKYEDCTNFRTYTPAGPKADLDNRVRWDLEVYYDNYNRDVVSGWNRPVVMEFGIKAD